MNYLFTAAVGLAIITIISAGGNSFVPDSTVKSITQQPTSSKLTDDEVFDAFKLKFKKKYATPELEMKAKAIFLEKNKLIEAHNILYELKLVSYKMGIWERSDMVFVPMQGLRIPTGMPTIEADELTRAHKEPATEEQLKSIIDNQGIISATMETADSSFLSYKRGVYNCERPELDLQLKILIIDYGTENNIDYWLCKTSWGSSFGESGFIKIVRRDSPCGLSPILI